MKRRHSSWREWRLVSALVMAGLISTVVFAAPTSAMTRSDAVRLADQASFGPTPSLVDQIQRQGAHAWIKAQFALPASQYRQDYVDVMHRSGMGVLECNRDFARHGFSDASSCWRQWFTAEPVAREFYLQAVYQPDQLRQRIALALSQWLVVAARDSQGAYALRNYQQLLRDHALGNYRDLLLGITLNPLMGSYLNMVDNDADAPNENYARELMQLFSIGPCRLRMNGEWPEGRCIPTYDNWQIREVSYLLTGWTYPEGGVLSEPIKANHHPEFFHGAMVVVPGAHNDSARTLPSGAVLAAGHTARSAVQAVIDDLLAHPNTPPFVSKQLIRHLVTSNPAPDYVERVAQAFASGRYAGFGTGQRGDMQATVAAVLLDAHARAVHAEPTYGRLREPVQYITNLLRLGAASTDGADFYWWWGKAFNQQVFNAPSVFNFYPADNPLPGSAHLVAPAFGIEGPMTSLARLNLAHGLLFWEKGIEPDPMLKDASGTQVHLDYWRPLAGKPDKLVDALSELMIPAGIDSTTRRDIIAALRNIKASDVAHQGHPGHDWRYVRVATAIYLLAATADYQIQR